MNLMPASHTRIAKSVHGRTLTVPTGSGGWRHPWFTTPVWMAKAKKWVASVTPGFVNGIAPMVVTNAGELRQAKAAFFATPIDARAGAAEIAQAARLAIGGEEITDDNSRLDVPLYLNPPVSLASWRSLGWDGLGRVPQFFLDRGAANPPASAAAQIQSGGAVNINSLERPKNLRLLRACDVFLIQPRTALTSEIELSPSGFVSGTGLVNQTLGVREPGPNEVLRIQTGTFTPASAQRLNFSQRNPNLIASDYEEKTWDELHLSTVYMLSPAGAAERSMPDASWQPFVKHETFWNMSWAQKQIRPVFNSDIFRPLVALSGILAGGAGIGSVSWFASSINDATQGALNILQAQSLAGSFWTPTGGGTTGSVPVTVPDPELTGLDKAARAAVKKRRAAAARRARSLDPAFPYEGRTFNLSLLT